MNYNALGVIAGVMLVQVSYAQMGCRAVQVTCSPELGIMSLRTLNYDETKSCEHNEKDLKKLIAQGVYPIPENDGPLIASTCKLSVGKLKVNVGSYVENGNIQGECGAYGAVAVVNLWLDDTQLLKEVPVQTCRMHPNYDAEDITFRDEGGNYSVMFGGNVNPKNNYYSFQTKTKSPEGFQLPITRWTVVGISDSTALY
jgi:hypothetical protein